MICMSFFAHLQQRIITAMCGNVLHYSQHKYASNVIERCLREGTQHERHRLIEEVIGEHNADTLSKMMRDQVVSRLY